MDDRQASATKRRALLQDQAAQPTGLAAWNPRTHGYVAAISFGLVMPLAAVISRCFRVRLAAPVVGFCHDPSFGCCREKLCQQCHRVAALLAAISPAQYMSRGL